jgi:hypothetical protein
MFSYRQERKLLYNVGFVYLNHAMVAEIKLCAFCFSTLVGDQLCCSVDFTSSEKRHSTVHGVGR